jgi:hypothetical protein
LLEALHVAGEAGGNDAALRFGKYFFKSRQYCPLSRRKTRTVDVSGV